MADRYVPLKAFLQHSLTQGSLWLVISVNGTPGVWLTLKEIMRHSEKHFWQLVSRATGNSPCCAATRWLGASDLSSRMPPLVVSYLGQHI